MDRHIGFTGTQLGMNKHQLAELHEFLRVSREVATHFHHGDCVGADAQAHSIARELGYCIVLHPPDNPSKRTFSDADVVLEELPYMERNLKIVESCELLVAAPKEMTERLRSGTWSTVRKAKRLKIPVIMMLPYKLVK